MKQTIIYILSLFILTFDLKAEGLYFQSYEVNKDLRTTLNLTPEETLSLAKGFSMDFDLKLRREKHNFGYIFRMIINDNQNLDLVVRSSSPSRSYFLIVGNENRLTYSCENNKQDDIEWTHITICYTKGNDELTLKIGDTVQKLKLNGTIPSFTNVKLFFGETKHHIYSTTDVAPMTIRNIELKQTGGKHFLWELCKHCKNEIRDKYHNTKATVTHPVWLIDQKAHWKKCATVSATQRHFWAFNEKDSKIYIAGPQNLYIYDLDLNQFFDTIVSKNSSCFYSDAARLLFDSGKSKLLSYEIDSTHIESFDFVQNRWESKHSTSSSPRFWHHNHFISSQDSSLYCFGGYGQHLYKSILKKFSFKTKQWQEKDLSSYITPRYLAALGQSSGKVYIFGGYGSQTGEQQVSPRYFYDLYELNPQNYVIKKIWEYDNLENSFVQGNSMVIDSEKKCFYTLCYPSEKYHSYIYLNKFSLEKPIRTILADSIPFLFNDTESMCDLYFDKKSHKFIALVQELSTQNQYEISIYSLNFPPITHSEIYQLQTSSSNHSVIYLISLLLFAITLLIFCYLHKKRRHSQKKKPTYPIIEKFTTNMEETNTEINTPHILKKRQSSITFLGGFQVIGINGDDITGAFTPTLKNLLVLILLNTMTKKKGISSEMLIYRFWYDKNESSARNNLSVNIKRLRSLLEQVGPIQVVHSNGYWTIELSDSITCDYKNVSQSLESIQENPNFLSENQINQILNQLALGTLLPSIQNEWIDEYKSNYTNQAIESLRLLLDIVSISNELKCKICNTILMLDSLDEDALIEKCKTLYILGRKGQAKNTYDTYCKNYLALLNTEFKTSFSDIIQKK